MTYLLPELVSTGDNDSIYDRKWCLSKKVNFLPNGLVDDVNYYKVVCENRDYTVSCYSKVDCFVK